MKRTWVVVVEQGIGHEYNNTISESEFYGPFTEIQARKLVKELEDVLADPEDEEHPTAWAMPLENISYRELLRKYKIKATD